MASPSQMLGYITRDGAPANLARLRPCPYPCDPDAKPAAVRHEGGPLQPLHQNEKSLGAPNKVARKPALPPFWNAELYGEAFGDFQGGRKKDEVLAGGAKRVGERAREKRISSTMGRRLEKLTDAMLAALQKRKDLHGGEKGVLLNAFHSIDAAKLGTVSPGGFIKTWSLLGVAVTSDEAMGLFLKYGHDKQGRMPYEVFTSALLAGRAKLVGMARQVRGPFRPSQLRRIDFSGKISYPQCRKAVYAPSGFDASLAVRSAELPKASLWLEFVYGYNGITTTSNNLFYTATGEAVYFMAGVGIVYDPAAHAQRFFLGHNDDVTCAAMHPDGKLVATGQVGREPYTCIWDTTTCREVARLPEERGSRGLVAVGFSPDGQKLVTVCTDNQHTVKVWDWRAGQVVSEGKGHNGTPPQVFGVTWNPNPGCDEFLTFGVAHVKLWRATKKDGYKPRALSFNKICSPFTVHCAVFLPSGTILAGTNIGSIAVFKDGKLRQVVPAHKDLGARAVAGVLSTRGLRCLCLSGDKRTAISGGADGRLLFWDVSSGTLGDLLRAVPLESPYGAGKDAPPKIRGLDWRPGEKPGEGSIVVGTSRGDLWQMEEASGSARVLIFGHSADLYGLAFNPVKAHVFATAAEHDRIFVWDGRRRRLLRTTSMGTEVARAIAWSSNGLHLAVGMAGGGVKVLDAANLQPLYWKKDRDAAIQEIKYSPDSALLAVGAHDCHIDIYSVAQNYKRIARCVGHSATVRHLDWCVDSALLQSNCSGYEILYWDARSGKQVRQNTRDVKWATWTCVLGFPVMGIWEKGSDGTDINAASRSRTGDFVVTSDDFGHVRLLNCPSLLEHAPARQYAGHSSHVMCVRFSPDNKRVVSVGGKDRAVFQWRTHALVSPEEGNAGNDENDRPRLKCEIENCRVCGRGSNATGPIVPRAPWDGGELGRGT